MSASAATAPVHALEKLRENFLEYTQGNLSEKDFKVAVSEYSKMLRDMRAAAPDRKDFIANVRAAAKAARLSGGLS